MMFPQIRFFRKFNIPRVDVFYSPTVALFKHDYMHLTSSSVAKSARVEFEYGKIIDNALRWRIVTHTCKKELPLATQRNRLRRQWSAALIEALKQRGMNHRGKAIEPSSEKQNELLGTLEMCVYQGHGFGRKTASLVDEAGTVVDALLQVGAIELAKQKSMSSRRQR